MARRIRKEYQYASLNRARGEQTRLLCLAAGSGDEDIHAKLQTFSLEDPELPPFTALSYTWGSRSKNAAIHMHSESLPAQKRFYAALKHLRKVGSRSRDAPCHLDTALLPITSNLHAALKHLRKANDERWVWVDAICINQADHAEKSYQVPNMHLVYRAATYCIAWLGPPSMNSELGMRTVRDMDHFLQRFQQPDAAVLSTPEWKAILDILNRIYFERIWIVQELAWAKDVYFTCGGIELHFDQFIKTIDVITRQQTRCFDGFGVYTLRLIQTLKSRVPENLISDNIYNSLLLVLTVKVGLMATDPRDHIYAALSFLPSWEWPSQPDYSKDTSRVFTDAAVHVMKTTHSLEFLRLCDANQRLVSLPRHLDECVPKHMKTERAGQWYAILPSWVPNWSTIAMRPSQFRIEPRHGLGSIIYACDAGTSSEVVILPSRNNPVLLSMHIIRYDTIRTCRSLPLDLLENGNAMEKLAHHAFGVNEPNSVYHSGQCSSLEEAFWRTLMLDYNGSYRATSTYVSDFAERAKNGNQLMDVELLDLKERAFLVTSAGMFGIGPKSSKPGDLIAMIPSCSVPMILRDVPGLGWYEIIGESYVHGIMDGEVKTALDHGECDLVKIYIT